MHLAAKGPVQLIVFGMAIFLDRSFMELPPSVVRVFIDGDCVPEPFFTLLRRLSSRSRVAVFAAFRPFEGKVSAWGTFWASSFKVIPMQEERLRSRLLASGIDDSLIFLHPSKTNAMNAADVILTFLFGRYAGTKNYLVSDDRQWFKEVVKSKPTVWITSDKFREP
ncbi:unnamed protein product [Effrenium voratum]|nr:unnamed protein product [Effrenium voratum]